MIVDDDPTNLRVLKSQLQYLGYQIEEAKNGHEALEKIDESKFDLIILDVMMPNLSGYEVCEKIRLTHDIHTLPIIFLTAKTQPNDLRIGYKIGGNDYIPKPFHKIELQSKVNVWLQEAVIKQKGKALDTIRNLPTNQFLQGIPNALEPFQIANSIFFLDNPPDSVPEEVIPLLETYLERSVLESSGFKETLDLSTMGKQNVAVINTDIGPLCLLKPVNLPNFREIETLFFRELSSSINHNIRQDESAFQRYAKQFFLLFEDLEHVINSRTTYVEAIGKYIRKINYVDGQSIDRGITLEFLEKIYPNDLVKVQKSKLVYIEQVIELVKNKEESTKQKRKVYDVVIGTDFQPIRITINETFLNQVQQKIK